MLLALVADDVVGCVESIVVLLAIDYRRCSRMCGEYRSMANSTTILSTHPTASPVIYG
jgi:hypothetical protein